MRCVSRGCLFLHEQDTSENTSVHGSELQVHVASSRLDVKNNSGSGDVGSNSASEGPGANFLNVCEFVWTLLQ